MCAHSPFLACFLPIRICYNILFSKAPNVHDFLCLLFNTEVIKIVCFRCHIGEFSNSFYKTLLYIFIVFHVFDDYITDYETVVRNHNNNNNLCYLFISCPKHENVLFFVSMLEIFLFQNHKYLFNVIEIVIHVASHTESQ